MSDTNTSGPSRRFPRRHFQQGVGILSGGKYFLGTAAELGEGGISFKSEKKLIKGALVVVSFQIPAGELISVRAEVRSLDPAVSGDGTVYGCAFEHIPFQSKKEIRNFVTMNSTLKDKIVF